MITAMRAKGVGRGRGGEDESYGNIKESEIELCHLDAAFRERREPTGSL